MIYWLYRVVGTAFFFLSYPFVSLSIRFQPTYRSVLQQRFGRAGPEFSERNNGVTRVWIHAASVGEVGAAVMLIRELTAHSRKFDFVVSTMTTTGRNVARHELPDTIPCFLAPYDLQTAVQRVVQRVQPDVYACLETELWPVMLAELKRAGVRMVLLNGRMTARSFKRYKQVRGLTETMLRGFSGIAVIRPQDRERFAGLGASNDRIRLTGNIKYDFPGEDIAALRKLHRDRLQVDDEIVFICGSTRTGEEKILAEVYRKLSTQGGRNLVWVVAPRHMKRLPEVEAMLNGLGMPFDLYTELEEKKRKHPVVLVDCLGELSRLYSAGDYIYVGGSLVNCGGHNLMEAARWGRPVYYGPFIDDFSDAEAILSGAGAGFMVEDDEQLVARILHHMQDSESYDAACSKALWAVSEQHGAAGKQAAVILDVLDDERFYREKK